MKSIYSLFEKGFLNYLHKKNGTKLTKDNLSFSFFDLDGNGYYKFPSDLALPMARLGKLHGYTKWLSSGVDGKELDIMLDNIDKALTEGIKTGKNAAKIGFVVSQLKERKTMIVHDELFYNIIAIQIIRHDESPVKFNQEIHQAKVEAFRKLNESNDTFFLNISEYLKALNWSNITKEELVTILLGSETHRKAEREMMEKLFENLSESQKATLNSL